MSPSAIEALRRQDGTSTEDLERAAQGVDLDRLMFDEVARVGSGFDIAGSVTSASMIRTMDGASSFTVTINDPERELLRSGVFGDGSDSVFPAIDIELDKHWFRLARIQKSGDLLTLEFEDRVVAWLRIHKEARKASRAKMTRAEFVLMLVREVKREKIRFVTLGELHKDQTKEKTKDKVGQKVKREQGVQSSSKKLTIGKVEITDKQRKNIDICMRRAKLQGARRKAIMAMLCAGCGESGFDDDKTDYKTHTHKGVFQSNQIPQHDTDTQCLHFLIGGRSFKAGGAIQMAKDHPEYSAGTIAAKVEISDGQASYYDGFLEEAEAIFKAYGGSASISVDKTYAKTYEFHRGAPDGPKGENTWDCSGRLASEVNWRRFVSGDTFYFVKDGDLIKAPSAMTLSEDTTGVDTIDFEEDTGKPVNEATVICRADRWFASVGQTVELEKCGNANGKWLVWSIERGDLFSTDTTITLRQPEESKKEPAPETITHSGQQELGGSVESLGKGDARARIVAAAKKALAEKSKYRYVQTRPYPNSLFGPAPRVFDCSSFSIGCYKSAGVRDPNGTQYNGTGYTGTLIANGKKTSSPQPGDLAFYGAGQGPGGSPRHVAVYIGAGQVISHGHPGAPNQYAAGQNDLIGFYSYDLSSNDHTPFGGNRD